MPREAHFLSPMRSTRATRATVRHEMVPKLCRRISLCAKAQDLCDRFSIDDRLQPGGLGLTSGDVFGVRKQLTEALEGRKDSFTQDVASLKQAGFVETRAVRTLAPYGMIGSNLPCCQWFQEHLQLS